MPLLLWGPVSTNSFRRLKEPFSELTWEATLQEVMLIGITAPLYAVHFQAPGWSVMDAVALLLCLTGALQHESPLELLEGL